MEKQKAIIISGYFNPVHKGLLEYFINAKTLADKLFVIVNNGHQRELKGSKEFQDENKRMIIVKRWIRLYSLLIPIEQYVQPLK